MLLGPSKRKGLKIAVVTDTLCTFKNVSLERSSVFVPCCAKSGHRKWYPIGTRNSDRLALGFMGVTSLRVLSRNSVKNVSKCVYFCFRSAWFLGEDPWGILLGAKVCDGVYEYFNCAVLSSAGMFYNAVWEYQHITHFLEDIFNGLEAFSRSCDIWRRKKKMTIKKLTTQQHATWSLGSFSSFFILFTTRLINVLCQ